MVFKWDVCAVKIGRGKWALACMGASWTFARCGSECKSIEVNGLIGWALDTWAWSRKNKNKYIKVHM